jgi:hypothetical protein
MKWLLFYVYEQEDGSPSAYWTPPTGIHTSPTRATLPSPVPRTIASSPSTQGHAFGAAHTDHQGRDAQHASTRARTYFVHVALPPPTSVASLGQLLEGSPPSSFYERHEVSDDGIDKVTGYFQV